jgi:hypothetical protein
MCHPTGSQQSGDRLAAQPIRRLKVLRTVKQIMSKLSKHDGSPAEAPAKLSGKLLQMAFMKRAVEKRTLAQREKEEELHAAEVKTFLFKAF